MRGLLIALAIIGAASEIHHRLANQVTVGGVSIDRSDPPAGLHVDSTLGLLLAAPLTAIPIHRQPAPEHKVDTPRGMVAPNGDYLIFVCAGQEQYGIPKARWNQKLNDLKIYRSTDRGQSWSAPTIAWQVDYPTAPVTPFVPKGSRRIYLFDTEPIPALRVPKEDGPIGYRTSDDNGLTWSAWQRIVPTNDPDFVGISQMRMCETADGIWLLGTHGGTKMKTREGTFLARQQYVLRSADRGHTWALLPGKSPHGWYGVQHDAHGAASIVRLQEGEFLSLADGSVLAMARTAEGHLWEFRSDAQALNWTEPQPTTLVHPDAPPMVYPLSDGQRLIALIHNRHNAQHPLFNQEDRTELWCSLSSDGGRHWSEPRFLLANLVNDARRPNTSYTDVFADRGILHFVMPHLWEEVDLLTMPEAELGRLPTAADLRSHPSPAAAKLFP